jgi:hypothetical protein
MTERIGINICCGKGFNFQLLTRILTKICNYGNLEIKGSYYEDIYDYKQRRPA